MNAPSKSSSQGFPMVSHAFPMVSHGFHAETRHFAASKASAATRPSRLRFSEASPERCAKIHGKNPWENDGFHVDLSISSRKMDGRWKFKPRKHGEKPDFLCCFGRYLMIKA